MDANREEAERCLREAEKWQRQNRPVRALKWAKKSHRLYPTAVSQAKVSELCIILRSRGFTDIDALLRDERLSTMDSDANDRVPPPPPPPNQPFVELDQNALPSNNRRNGHQESISRILSTDFWRDLLESTFGSFFASAHSKLSPFLPPTLANFTLRHRTKVWLLLLIAICLLFTRFAIVGHSFGANSRATTYPNKQFKSVPPSGPSASSTHWDERSHANRPAPSPSHAPIEQKRRDFESKYRRDGDERFHHDHNNNDNYYDKYHQPRHHHRDHHDVGGGYGQSSSFDLFSPSGLMTLLFVGSILVAMIANQRNGGGNGENGNGNGNGFNWNMMLLPMMMGGGFGGGMGGGYGRRWGGGFGRRRRNRFFF